MGWRVAYTGLVPRVFLHLFIWRTRAHSCNENARVPLLLLATLLARRSAKSSNQQLDSRARINGLVALVYENAIAGIVFFSLFRGLTNDNTVSRLSEDCRNEQVAPASNYGLGCERKLYRKLSWSTLSWYLFKRRTHSIVVWNAPYLFLTKKRLNTKYNQFHDQLKEQV